MSRRPQRPSFLGLSTVLLIVALTGACAPRAVQPTAQAPAEIVVGAALPLTGAEARPGGFVKQGYEMAAEEINRDGGISVREFNKKIPVKLILLDDQTDKNLSRNLYERLATVDKVSAFLGGYSTGLGVAHAPVADQYKLPYVTGGEGGSEIFSRDQKYVFGLLASVENLAISTMSWIAKHQDDGGLPRPLKIALVWENSPHGKEYQRGVRQVVDKEPTRYQIVIDESFQYPGATDHRPLLNKVKAAGGDVLLSDAHLEDYILMQRQVTELGMQFMVVTYGARGPEKTAREQLGVASNYVVAANWWSKELPYPQVKEFNSRFRAKYDSDPEWYHAMGYEAARTLFQAIEQAGTLRADAIRDALARTNETKSILPGQKVAFPATGHIDAPFVVTQNMPDGTTPIVWPPDAATGEAVVPIPGTR